MHIDFRRRAGGNKFGWNTFVNTILSISATMDLCAYHHSLVILSSLPDGSKEVREAQGSSASRNNMQRRVGIGARPETAILVQGSHNGAHTWKNAVRKPPGSLRHGRTRRRRRRHEPRSKHADTETQARIPTPTPTRAQNVDTGTCIDTGMWSAWTQTQPSAEAGPAKSGLQHGQEHIADTVPSPLPRADQAPLARRCRLYVEHRSWTAFPMATV